MCVCVYVLFVIYTRVSSVVILLIKNITYISTMQVASNTTFLIIFIIIHLFLSILINVGQAYRNVHV